ncbi:MAG: tRNA uridine(34) 5-carboxymethylaminomethyl modification radical SAM/GNAT enzyme Elp3 [Leptolinea sp.]|nr:tRNA uridine(34) 5-carboxymethylaminomethyl modification radical SAM/GNAT enzyme Elp3 [Leptolinea sp.]
MVDMEKWTETRRFTPEKMAAAREILEEIKKGTDVFIAIRKNPMPGVGYLAKHTLVEAYRRLVSSGEWTEDIELFKRIRLKPVRTLSGVTTVTVLTGPHACPGECIFCPNDTRLPKSYLYGEPGAMRGMQNDFDPYMQTASRLEALDAVGHPVDKIELLILGGTFTAYEPEYQEWFIRRCFDAMNGFDSSGMEEAHRFNEGATHRNVGLVIETRPDEITPAVLTHLRELGVTKVQIGAQSLDDRLLQINKRGHTAGDTLRAVGMLRAAGFKVVLHWMPNLLGATLESDREDFVRLWNDGYCPDELKIYPTQLVEKSELYDIWQKGGYVPYTTDELIQLIADLKNTIPRYCRVNRVIRDIPSNLIAAGNKRSSLRMDVKEELDRRGQHCQCVRCREVRGEQIKPDELVFHDLAYDTPASQEHFLSFDTPQDKLTGYLRLSLPDFTQNTDVRQAMPDLKDAAIIREVHVFGQSLPVGSDEAGAAQHTGLGTTFLAEAERIAREKGYARLAVIAAVGTRLYYNKRGFERGTHYFVKELSQVQS